MRRFIQNWNQPEQRMSAVSYGCYWNPSRGNIRVGNTEVKWYNYILK